MVPKRPYAQKKMMKAELGKGLQKMADSHK